MSWITSAVLLVLLVGGETQGGSVLLHFTEVASSVCWPSTCFSSLQHHHSCNVSDCKSLYNKLWHQSSVYFQPVSLYISCIKHMISCFLLLLLLLIHLQPSLGSPHLHGGQQQSALIDTSLLWDCLIHISCHPLPVLFSPHRWDVIHWSFSVSAQCFTCEAHHCAWAQAGSVRVAGVGSAAGSRTSSWDDGGRSWAVRGGDY